MADNRKFTDFPTIGFWYRIKKGDFLNIISGKVYGDRLRWTVIWEANQTQLASNDPDNPQIGETVFIPELPERRKIERTTKETIPGKGPNEFTLFIAGREIPVESGSLVLSIDTLADAWTARIAWIPGFDPKLDEITKKYSYSESLIYIGGKLQASGKLYTPSPELTTGGGNSKTLEFYSHTMELVRNTVKPPYQANKVSLLQRCQFFTSKFGLNTEIDVDMDDQFENDINSIFDRVTIEPTETIFEHLKSLATQRGILLTSTIHGDLLLTRAAINSKIVAELEEGKSPFPQEFKARFDGLNRFAVYRLIGQTPGNHKLVGVAKDETVLGSSHTTINSSDSTGGDIRGAADYAKNKHVADAYSQELPLTSWYLPTGDLIKKNTLINVISPTIDAPDGFVFLNRSVQFIHATGGQTSSISIVPPSVYSKLQLVEAGI